MKPSHELWSRCVLWAGGDPSPEGLEKLERFRDWLLAEAVNAGGLGPNEGPRMDRRHIGDSLLFAGGIEGMPARVLDVGSGVGLPGIPLSIMMPDSHFLLLDRSGRKVDLMRRVSRILELPNVEVIQGEVTDVETEVDAIVSRGSLSPERAILVFPRLLVAGGTAVLGGSWVSPPAVSGLELLEVPAAILDQRVWLLIMQPQ